ncbi:hypothetical protein CEQ90_14330 [Lewinellaceae bacterium SD302]|nr:hypothetical protein CEQ90_14330 [Lewinellaceae bacterium SD302]
MNQLVKKSGLILIAILLAYGCRETPITPEIEEEQPVICLPGFTLTPQDSCICDTPQLPIGEFICSEIMDGQYYSTMEGCVVALEHLVTIEDSIWLNDLGEYTSYVYRYNTTIRLLERGRARRFAVQDSTDGIAFPLSGDPNYMISGVSAMPYFTGRVYAEDSIVGIIRYVDFAEYDLILSNDSCQVKYINARHLE